MPIYAIVDSETREVVNIVEWDGSSEWELPDGVEAVAQETVEESIESVDEEGIKIGATITDDGEYVPPEEIAPE